MKPFFFDITLTLDYVPRNIKKKVPAMVKSEIDTTTAYALYDHKHRWPKQMSSLIIQSVWEDIVPVDMDGRTGTTQTKFKNTEGDYFYCDETLNGFLKRNWDRGLPFALRIDAKVPKAGQQNEGRYVNLKQLVPGECSDTFNQNVFNLPNKERPFFLRNPFDNTPITKQIFEELIAT